MKNKFLTFLIAIIAVSSFAFSQSKPLTKKQLDQSEFISAEHIILVTKNKKINTLDIDPSNIISLLGKPKQIQKKKSEIDDEIHTTYIYESGEIDFDDHQNLYDLEIKKTGWSLILKVNDKTTKPFTIGTGLEQIKSTFPDNFSKVKNDQKEHFLSIGLITKQGVIIDSFVSFRIKDGHVNLIISSEDDS